MRRRPGDEGDRRKLKGDQIFSQLERMGASLDWDRKAFTMDEVGQKDDFCFLYKSDYIEELSS